MKKICLIGGGTSNLFTAIELSNSKNDVTIIEGYKLGRKILASGNGRCNIANSNINSNKYFNNSFVDAFLTDYKSIKNYLESKGILLTSPDSDGRVYPISYHSSIVLNKINELISNCKIVNEIVDTIKKDSNGFIVGNSNYKEHFDIVVVGIGSNADCKYKKNPLEESLISLGHKYTKSYPSICPLRVIENINTLNGIRAKVNITLDIDGKRFDNSGELLFKDKEISGIVVFELSTILAHYRRNNKVDSAKVIIDLLPNTDLKAYFEELNVKTYKELLSGLFVNNMVNYLLKINNLNEKSLIDKNLDKLINSIHNFTLTIDLKKYSNIYQVVNGGIDIKDINTNLESKLVNNLYFGGEVLDIDGPCGGYNLSMCISTGIKIANSIKNK